MTVLQFHASYLLLGVLITLSVYGIYSVYEDAIRSRREEAEDEAVEQFRWELEGRGVALFEIPDSSADSTADAGEERQ